MKPNILFIGGTPRGLELMRQLTNRKEKVVHAYILQQDDHEPYKVSDTLEMLCRANQIPATVCRKIGDDQLDYIARLKADIGFVCGWRTLLPSRIYNDILFGCLAAHDSLLPKYRGFAPTSWAIINGEKETGVTLFKISDQGADAGPVWGQKSVPIGFQETASHVYPRILSATVELYLGFLEAYAKNEITYHEQNHEEATYAKRRTPDDGQIDWNEKAVNIYNLIRALNPPYPYAWTTINGEKVYIKSAELDETEVPQDKKPGSVESLKEGSARIYCKDGMINIKEVVNSNGEVCDASKYFESSSIVLG